MNKFPVLILGFLWFSLIQLCLVVKGLAENLPDLTISALEIDDVLKLNGATKIKWSATIRNVGTAPLSKGEVVTIQSQLISSDKKQTFPASGWSFKGPLGPGESTIQSFSSNTDGIEDQSSVRSRYPTLQISIGNSSIKESDTSNNLFEISYDQSQPVEVVRAYLDAVRMDDVEGALKMSRPNPELELSNRDQAAAFRNAFADTKSQANLKQRPIRQRIMHQWAAVIMDSPEQRSYSEVFLRRENGKWKIPLNFLKKVRGNFDLDAEITATLKREGLYWEDNDGTSVVPTNQLQSLSAKQFDRFLDLHSQNLDRNHLWNWCVDQEKPRRSKKGSQIEEGYQLQKIPEWENASHPEGAEQVQQKAARLKGKAETPRIAFTSYRQAIQQKRPEVLWALRHLPDQMTDEDLAYTLWLLNCEISGESLRFQSTFEELPKLPWSVVLEKSIDDEAILLIDHGPLQDSKTERDLRTYRLHRRDGAWRFWFANGLQTSPALKKTQFLLFREAKLASYRHRHLRK